MKKKLDRFVSLIVLIAFVFSSSLVRAENILFLSQQAKEEDYVVFLQTKPQYESFVEFWLGKNPTKNDVSHLLDVFERAQLAYLNNPFDEAKTLFENVVQLAHQSDWRNSQRELLFTAFLRLAQLEQSEESKKHYLKRAIALDHEMEPNTSLFPPPLVNEFKDLRKEMRSHALIWRKPVEERTSVILLNGKKISFNKPILIVEGFHRLTVVSNRHTLWTKVLSQRDFDNLYVEQKPYSVGTCQQPQMQGLVDVGLLASEVFYESECTKENSKKKLQIAQALAPEYRPSSFETASYASAPSEPVWKKTWFWLAIAGVALTAVVISQNNQKESSPGPQPTNTKGL